MTPFEEAFSLKTLNDSYGFSHEEVIFYAHQGRIDTLFIADGEKVWGTFDFKKQTLKVHREQDTGDHDLLNISAVQTMLNGGDVYVVASEKVPDGSQLAAILRY